MVFARLFARARRFRRDQSGMVVVLFALMAPVVIAGAGLAIDLIMAHRLKIGMQGVLDEAALAGAKAGVDYIIKNPGANRSATTLAQNRAKSFFTASVGERQGLVQGVTVGAPVFTVTTLNGAVTVNATLSMVQPLYLLRVLGNQTMSINLKTTANVGSPSYSNFTLILDVSQSMGIAAGPAEMKQLYNLLKAKTGEGCVFACHGVVDGLDAYLYAKQNNVPLRMDSLRTAVKTLLADAKASTASSYMTFSFNTMGQGLTSTRPSGNYTYLNSLADNLDLEPSIPVGAADSYLNEGLSTIANTIPRTGTGATSSSPKQYAVLVSDGLFDTWGPNCNWNHCTGPVDTSLCQAIKDKGVTLFVIYTTYYPIFVDPTDPSSGYDGRYLALAIDQQPKIAPAMQACATSSQHFFEASDSVAMSAAFKQIFYMLQSVRLTN